MIRRSFLLALILVASSAAAEAQGNFSWPRQTEVDGGTVVLYQPQIELLELDHVESRA